MPAIREAERLVLLRLARAALVEHFRGDGSLARVLAEIEPSPTLREVRGVFVSLKRRTPDGGETLRGCIGCMTTRGPLYVSVCDLARKAALEDPRFDAVSADELDDLRLELSVLTPVRPVDGPDAIEVGRHGVELSSGTARAVFLPQVATEQGWTVERLLGQLARKAGLAETGWREARLGVFEAEVFGEAPRREQR